MIPIQSDYANLRVDRENLGHLLDRQVMARLAEYLRPHWRRLALAVVTMFWVAGTLNGMGVTTPLGAVWSPAKVANMLRNHSYTGQHAYNVNELVANPNRPITDITAEIKRTLLRQKPEEEWVKYEVPKIVDEDLWERANRQVKARGRGRGKQAKSIQALLRSRLFCPRCAAPMVVRRNGRLKRVYYHCSTYSKKWSDNPCTYSKFIPGNTWDEVVWMDVCTLLRDDTWIEKEVKGRQISSGSDVEKLIRLEEFKITQGRAKIAKIQEGFEGALYDLEEAKRRTASYHDAVAKADDELKRISSFEGLPVSKGCNNEAIRQELRELRDRNLDGATFEERVEVVTKLGIEVYPAEDLKSMKVRCRIGHGIPTEREQGPVDPTEPESGLDPAGCGIVSYAPPQWHVRRVHCAKTFAAAFRTHGRDVSGCQSRYAWRRSMYVRLVRFTFGPGKHSAAEDLANKLVPAIDAQKGCNSVALFGDATDGEYGLVVMWESKEDAEAAAAVIGPQLQQGLAGNVQGPPDIRLFEVIEQRA